MAAGAVTVAGSGFARSIMYALNTGSDLVNCEEETWQDGEEFLNCGLICLASKLARLMASVTIVAVRFDNWGQSKSDSRK